MNLKKIIPVSVVLISAIFLGAFFVYENNEPKEKLIIATSYEILKSFHYSPQNLDDTYSERVFNLYMKSLDYNKMFFTKDQIDILSSYKTKIDDEIKSSSLDFFNLSIELLDKQIDKIQNLYQSVLEKPFDYNVKESINLKFQA